MTENLKKNLMVTEKKSKIFILLFYFVAATIVLFPACHYPTMYKKLRSDKSLLEMSGAPKNFNIIFLFLSGNNILEGTITRILIKMAINLSLIIIS